MCLTAHWIDNDWELQKRIIIFCIVENHKGETIGKQIEECLHEWGIDKVCTITVDNASSNDRAIAHLKKKCKWKDVILNNDCMHMRCSAHIVNLIVKQGLEEQHESIMRVRNAVKYVRSSPARLKAFKRNFVKFLKIFYNVTLKFSGSSYITSNAFFRELATLHVSLTTMMNKGDYHMASMAIRMRDKFNKYWGNIDNMNWFLFVAILLDLRYKLKYVSFGLATIYGSDPFFVKRMTEKIEDMLHLLYKQYAHSSLEHTSKDKDSIQDYIFMQLDGEDDPSVLLESQFAKHLEEEQYVESISEVT
ncbi:UNVERIFIED_CONTAM: putative AC transposase [Sesamum latifolium]|uniref:AC transposase n=1 Tax=Sesamum latifolium TaxID=2727402 RepID=A0AAW2WR76_9LAMI